ncbi:exopolysaccharide biosynthesis protein [Roseibium sp. RKSG952]|uniref:exopolysaccharide biosynthesis protein n=1 Tax=Roseibium sp. RKSG952 TaxID=2529384 RepID=UPI0012BCB425|nr:exopolysaccharide biosynthesis protein [Roseibium sp. RKSG952]MTH95386.1 exopolysaccharide biosynthesis protein [Roseibium sp. RKSG952]
MSSDLCASPTVFTEVRRIIDTPEEQMTIGSISEGLGKRSYGIILFVLCLPNCIPAPPGLGSIFGLAMGIVVIQYLLGRDYPILPSFIGKRAIKKTTLRRIMDTSEPFMRRLEMIIRPRMFGPAQRFLEYLGMLAVAFMCLVILIPLPLTNMLPAMAAAVLSASVAERDAAGIIVGLIIGIAGSVIAVRAASVVVALLF